ncbi:hypothetical protein GT037_011140 [Alternaria burnsii]|uniref:GFO/IDH/MocA-like oxidoreductase domain-containing protein n=1 Tax=Alternaria burnsii TaxID=1187904 RepID=A0A8H7AUE0_9PLEO|nr:uncharacterized protein GT037_011140 [Alternaria burnsii]KAF7670689.1 hypothetical protein GT037_011140 [Alternaria burnsii]
MCEKPNSVDVITAATVIEKAQSRPDLKFLVPFTRRYDKSYCEAKDLIESGELGEIHAVETWMSDVQDPAGHFVAFAAHSCGIFLDMGIYHRVTAIGQRAVYTDLAAFGDADNAWGFVEFTNGKVWTTHLARTATNGLEDSTRVCGTKGHSIVSSASIVEIRDKHGVRKQTVPDAFKLFPQTYETNITGFTNAILFDNPLTSLAEDAVEAGKICTALQHSYRAGQSVYFNDEGFPILNDGTPTP